MHDSFHDIKHIVNHTQLHLPTNALGAVDESVERGPRVQEIGSFIPGEVKPMTYKNVYLSLHNSALIG